MNAIENPGELMLIRKIIFLFAFFPVFAIGQPSLIKTFYCPPISVITKDPVKQTWSAPGGYKSYDLSFVNRITNFLGAQWRGATVGQITCVYKGLPPKSFNVLLVFNTLSYEPTQGAWGKNLGGYRNCISRKRSQCAFKVAVKPKKDNIYEDIEKLKS